MGLKRGGTLCQQVPALGELSASGAGHAVLMPIGFDHPPIELVSGVNRIGRDQDLNDVMIISDQVSRCHCEVLVQDDEIWIKDLASSNGTFVNDQRIGRHQLEPGDELGISPRIKFRLVLDDELEAPEEVNLGLDPSATIPEEAGTLIELDQIEPLDTSDLPATEGKPPAVPKPPPLPQADPALALEEKSSISIELPADHELRSTEEVSLVEQLEKQRNVLAVLYQISLRCLMASGHKEIELLLTNVLKRLTQLDAGFILYRSGKIYRASIVPGLERPQQRQMRQLSKVGLALKAPMICQSTAELGEIGLTEGTAALVPMQLDSETVGVICCLSDRNQAYSIDDVDIISQMANVATAALVQRA